jgi:hypothetical protein
MLTYSPVNNFSSEEKILKNWRNCSVKPMGVNMLGNKKSGSTP